MRTPRRRDSVLHGKQRVGICGHVQHAEITFDERNHQTDEREKHQAEKRDSRISREVHHRHPAP